MSQHVMSLPKNLSRRYKLLIHPLVIAIAVMLLTFALVYGNRNARLQRAKQEHERLRQEVVEQKEKNKVLFEEIQHLKSDRFTVEKIAREQLQLSKAEDVIIKLNDKPKSGDPVTPPLK